MQLEKRLGRLEGETSVEEKKALQEKIQGLDDRKDFQDKQELLLRNQLKRLEDELRRVGRAESKNREDEANLQGKIDEMDLYLDSTQRLIKKVTREKLVFYLYLNENLAFTVCFHDSYSVDKNQW